MIDYATLFRANLPAAAGKYNGFPKYNFVGGHNDAASVPVDELVAAASEVLKREGATLATYGLNSGPQGYRPLREFLAKKLAKPTPASPARRTSPDYRRARSRARSRQFAPARAGRHGRSSSEATTAAP